MNTIEAYNLQRDLSNDSYINKRDDMNYTPMENLILTHNQILRQQNPNYIIDKRNLKDVTETVVTDITKELTKAISNIK